MLIKTNTAGFIHPAGSEITPARIYQSRRDMIRLMGSGVAGAALATWAGREALAQATGWAPPAPTTTSMNLAPTRPTRRKTPRL